MIPLTYPAFLAGNEPYIANFDGNVGFIASTAADPTKRCYVVMRITGNNDIEFFKTHATYDYWQPTKPDRWTSQQRWKFGQDWNQLQAVYLVTDNIEDGIFVFAEIFRQIVFIGRLHDGTEFTGAIATEFGKLCHNLCVS